ncbi:methionine/alanine import family NSS transporter small subunit [Stackebrandtia soli]
MSTGAIIMLVISIVIVWGGLIGAILLLRAHPEDSDLPEAGSGRYGPPRR